VKGRWPLVLAWLLPLLVYALSARRDVWFWDTGEMDTVPWILGIAHPTGFPAYVVSGFVFSHVLPFGSVALRMSLMSALAMSGAAWFVARCVDDEADNPWIAAGCAWIFAFGSIAWTRGARAEVHALAAFTIAATIFFALRWYRTEQRRDFYLASLAWGVGLAVHPVVVLLLPGLLLLFVARLYALQGWEPAVAMLLALAAAAIWYPYLPLRSAYVTAHALDPTRSLGLPIGGAFWDYDHPASWRGFVALAGGGDFDVSGGFHALFSRSTYGTGLAAYAVQFVNEFTPFGTIVAAAGVVAGALRDRIRTIALVLFGIACIPFGIGFPPESDPNRYFLTSFIVAAIFIGEAAAWLAQRLPRARVLPAVILAGIACALLVENRWIFTEAADASARALISGVQHATPGNAVLVANWEDAPPLAYAAYVEHSLDRRIVEAAWLSDVADQVPRWAATRPVFAIGEPPDEVPGYRLAAVRSQALIYRLVPR
jgi:hypothetical protein